MSFHCPDQYRIRKGEFASNPGDPYGAFFVPGNRRSTRPGWPNPPLRVIATDGVGVDAGEGGGWEHVSVSLPDRCPTWDEMCYVKSLFWDVEDCVLQFHPPESRYVNNHPYCLHLWRPTGVDIPTPPTITVGFV